ncbi:MAG: cyclic nucleotide-binding domain-containing protein [Proteobacteria bacterium]|nr:cyclic nucleotide-binding domain-containing protein [Pseudomonadota bacterium]
MQELVRKYIAGTYVFREGEAAAYAFILCNGKVRQFRVQGPREIVFDELMEGRLFGEAALVERRPRPFSAITPTGCECYAIDRRDYNLRLSRIDPQQARALRNLHIFIDRVPLYDAQGKRIVGTVSEDVERKIAALLESDLGVSLVKTGDALIDIVAEQVLHEAKRRLPLPAEDEETTRQRDRLKPTAKPATVPSP